MDTTKYGNPMLSSKQYGNPMLLYNSMVIKIYKSEVINQNMVEYTVSSKITHYDVNRYFSELQLETILPYFENITLYGERHKSIILNLLFSNNKIKEILAINLIKNEFNTTR